MGTRNGATRAICKVWAPAEGDSPEDATWWYFRTEAEAEDFANDGWGADYGVTNYSEAAPFAVTAQSVSKEQFVQLTFTNKQADIWLTPARGDEMTHSDASSSTEVQPSSARENLCTFCDQVLDSSEEHILLSAIGGRKTSRRVICSHHNNVFGSTIDRALSDQLAFFSNALAIRTGRNGVAPTLRGLQTTAGTRVDLAPGGRALQHAKVEEVETGPTRRQLTITATSEEQARTLLATYMRKYPPGTSLSETTLVQTIQPLNAPIRFNGEIGGESSYRAIGKLGLLLLASETGTEAVRGNSALAIRDFVTNGGDAIDLIRHDYTTEFPIAPQAIALAPYAHHISTFASPDQRVAVAFVELFGTFRFSILLSDAWTGPAVSLLYSVDPVSGDHIETRDKRAPPIRADQFRCLPSDPGDLGPRIQRLFACITDRQISLSIDEISHDATMEILTPARIAEGGEFTEDDAARIAQEATSRFMAHHMQVPYKKTLDSRTALTPNAPQPTKSRRSRKRPKKR